MAPNAASDSRLKVVAHGRNGTLYKGFLEAPANNLAIADGVLERWFTPAFRTTDPVAVELTRQMLLSSPVEGYTACCAAVRDMDAREAISRIQLPVLVISGTHDPVTTPQDGKFMRDAIPGAEYKELPAAHLSNVEVEEGFTMEVSRFLKA